MESPSQSRTSRPTSQERERASQYLDTMKAKWRFAKTMPQWPHWFILRKEGSGREFDFLERLIKRCGYGDPWGKRHDFYLVRGKFKYWVLDDVLNRAAPIPNAEVRRRGERWLKRHGMKVGPYGHAIHA